MFELYKEFTKKSSNLYIVIFVLLIGLFLGSYTRSNQGISDNCPIDLAFVKSEQDCNEYKDAADKISSVQDAVKEQVKGYIDTGRARRVSVFFRDLDSQKFGYINQTEQFLMASLLKVPLAIAYYRLAEITPDLLTQQIPYDGKLNLYSNQEIQPADKLVAGKVYTVRELIRRALVFSDNTAAQLLTENYVSYDYLQKILFILGLQPNQKDQSQNLVTSRIYAGIFRTLYNSSFLSREYSDEILKLLSESTFTQGASAGLPKEAVVAHKFAERSFYENDTRTKIVHQLHDCGIVYAENGNNPYSFCIMTEGDDLLDLESVIKNISSTIYNKIEI